MTSAFNLSLGPKIVGSDCESQINFFERLLETDPECAATHAELGTLYYGKEEHSKALKHFEHAARLEPANPQFRKCLGDFYYTVLSRNEDALAQYEKVLDLNPLDSEVMLIAANLMVARNHFEKAEQLYRRLLDIEPWRDDILQLIAKLDKHRKGGCGRHNDEKHRQAQWLADDGRFEEAIGLLEAMVAEDPLDAMAHNDLGVLKYKDDKISEARDHYERAVALDSRNLVYKKNLAEYYLFVNNEVEKALGLYVTILKESPHDIDALLAAGDICVRFQRLDDARLFFNAILDIEPWNLDVSQRLDALTAQRN